MEIVTHKHRADLEIVILRVVLLLILLVVLLVLLIQLTSRTRHKSLIFVTFCNILTISITKGRKERLRIRFETPVVTLFVLTRQLRSPCP